MDKTNPVAVIIVNWNSGKDLEKCLAALTHQTRPPQEVIVVDNASSDDSLSGIEEQFPHVELIRLHDNTGFSHANNLGAEKVKACDWIAFLNPDAFAEPNWLENLIRAAEGKPEFSFFGSHMLRHGAADAMDGTGDIYHVSGLAWRRDHGLSASKTNRRTDEIFSACAAAAMIQKDIFLEAGGFDETFHSYFEDVDLGFRIRLAGHRCLYVADAVVEHVGSGSTHRTSDYAVYHGNRNLVWAYVKNMPSYLLWIYLPQHLLANIAALLWFTIQGKGKVIFRAKWDAVKGLPRVLAQRKTIQGNLKVSVREIRRVLVKGWFLPYSKRKRAV
ncbi:MAG: glycosyltransferase family 2 protein [Nitrospinae bacterium]|nr:glycosyltransferase family 2 protein [Nitrospinota bacterium]